MAPLASMYQISVKLFFVLNITVWLPLVAAVALVIRSLLVRPAVADDTLEGPRDGRLDDRLDECLDVTLGCSTAAGATSS
jgi:hypothetical protein